MDSRQVNERQEKFEFLTATLLKKVLLSLSCSPQLLLAPTDAGFLCAKAVVFGTAIKESTFMFRSFFSY
jgi:hypothetical protein